MTQLNKGVLLCFSCLLLASALGCGSSSTAIATTPNAFLYAANSFRPGSMAAFTVTTGALGCIPGTTCSPFATTGNAPYTLAAVSTKFLYGGVPASPLGGVINRVCSLRALPCSRPLSGSVAGGVLMMPINSDHTLSTPQMFGSGGDYDPIAVAPSGNFLYALDLTANLIVPFSIDGSKGTLTAIPQGAIPVGPDPFNVVIDPGGKFVFVANCNCSNPGDQGSVQVFSINTDGTLHAVGTFTIGSGAIAHPIALAVSPDSQFLFVGSLADSPSLPDQVYVESIAANGTLSPAVQAMPAVNLPAGSAPITIAVSADGGSSVYIGNAGTGTISFFLNCVQATLPTGCTGGPPSPLVFQNNSAVLGTVGVILLDPTSNSSTTPATGPGHFLYVTDYDHGTILVFTVTSTTSCTTPPCTPIPGTLTQSGSAVNTSGKNPFGLAIAH